MKEELYDGWGYRRGTLIRQNGATNILLGLILLTLLMLMLMQAYMFHKLMTALATVEYTLLQQTVAFEGTLQARQSYDRLTTQYERVEAEIRWYIQARSGIRDLERLDAALRADAQEKENAP